MYLSWAEGDVGAGQQECLGFFFSLFVFFPIKGQIVNTLGFAAKDHMWYSAIIARKQP